VTSPSGSAEHRRVLVIAHTGRADAREVAGQFCLRLSKHGIALRLLEQEAVDLALDLPDLEVVQPGPAAASGCEVVIVIGGDGTILRAAELARECSTPLLGVNLGHVGFLAEAESDDVDITIDAVVHRRYSAEERLTIDVSVYRDFGGDKELVCTTWALNEASVEKAARERMLEVVVEIDGRPLSRWGCDGVVCATPTGSTAYNFSAGGPIVWPGVEALLIVPISAHALFARPMVVAPTSVLAVEVMARTDGSGVLWCDGRRTVDLPPGARIEVRRGHTPVHLVRLHQAPFTDRLVAKFGLPVGGWRGAAERRRDGSRAGSPAGSLPGSPEGSPPGSLGRSPQARTERDASAASGAQDGTPRREGEVGGA
jgi:NAD+ kinase